jgi:hypothetical protein
VSIESLLEVRRKDTRYHQELWTFVARQMGRNLRNLSDAALQDRLEQLERNIQYLDDGTTGREDLPPEHGWLSPWWWLRARHCTLLEFDERSVRPPKSTQISAMPPLAPRFQGIVAGGTRLLVRISQTRWLLDTLGGVLRFVPASRYLEAGHEQARADDELGKSYRRPGQDRLAGAMVAKWRTLIQEAIQMRGLQTASANNVAANGQRPACSLASRDLD